MRPDTRACLACVAVFACSVSYASANDPSLAGWASVAPSATTVVRTDSLINPLATEHDTRQAALDDLRAERDVAVDLDFGSFGIISAARRIGTIEHAYSQYAYHQYRALEQYDSSLSVFENDSEESYLTAESLGIELTDETPYEVRRILRVLFKGVESDRAIVYHTWAQNLSSTHLDAALHELAELVDTTKSNNATADEAVQKADIRSTHEYQLALAQLRKAKELNVPHKPTLKELDRLRGILDTNTNDAAKAREALQSILFERIMVPEASLIE